MKNNKPNNDLNDQMKKDLREAKTKEDLDALVSSAGMELGDDDLDAAAGGVSVCGENCNDFIPGGPGFYCQERIGTIFS